MIKHEVLHISFGHLILRDKYPDHKLFNIAADIEINQYIADDYLPEGGLTLETFSDLDLPKKAGTDTYYKLLQEAKEEGNCDALNDVLDQMNGDSQYDHQTWDEFDDLTEADKKLVQKQIEHQLKETAETTEKKTWYYTR